MWHDITHCGRQGSTDYILPFFIQTVASFFQEMWSVSQWTYLQSASQCSGQNPKSFYSKYTKVLSLSELLIVIVLSLSLPPPRPQGIHQDRTTKLPAAAWDVTLAVSLMPHIIDSSRCQNQLRSLTNKGEAWGPFSRFLFLLIFFLILYYCVEVFYK